MPTGCQLSFLNLDDKRLVSQAVGTGFGGLCRHEGEPCSRGSKDRKWLVHTSYQHSLWSKHYKRLVPTVCRHSFSSEDDQRLLPPAVGTC